jgi:predicted protein tyrosine phosphatase
MREIQNFLKEKRCCWVCYQTIVQVAPPDVYEYIHNTLLVMLKAQTAELIRTPSGDSFSLST